jgi:hypothetical protein
MTNKWPILRLAIVIVMTAICLSVFVWLNGGLCVASLPKAALLEQLNQRFLKDANLNGATAHAEQADYCTPDPLARVDVGFSMEANCKAWTNLARTTFEGRRYAATKCGTISYLYDFTDKSLN